MNTFIIVLAAVVSFSVLTFGLIVMIGLNRSEHRRERVRNPDRE